MNAKDDEDIRQAMLSGRWFHPVHPDLIADSDKAQAVMLELDTSPALDDHGRMALLRTIFGHIGENSFMMPGVRFDYGRNINIGDDCFFNFDCLFLDGAPISFGDRVMVGPRCQFLTPLHPMLARERFEFPSDGSRPLEWEKELPVRVENDVWIGAGVIVNPGVSIGAGPVIGSGSVVTRNVPRNVFAAGNPCRVIREITEEDACGLA